MLNKLPPYDVISKLFKDSTCKQVRRCHAYVTESKNGKNKILLSYMTTVAWIIDGYGLYIKKGYDHYSVTTTRHVAEFFNMPIKRVRELIKIGVIKEVL